jgi:rhodanese-related sulfurtransferase
MDDIEISPTRAWDSLARLPSARLVDVRTEAEWRYVGEPNLSSLGKDLVKISWHLLPDMKVNPAFLDQVRAAAQPKNMLLFLCRSGGRSLAAARAAKRAGFMESYSVACGFEGDLDEFEHRSNREGWKHQGLPWRQT